MSEDTMAPRVFIFRHGETEWAKLGRSTGLTDIELTQAGMRQVSSAAAMFVGAGKLLDPRRLSIVTGKVTYTEDIAEWDYGEYEGRTDKEIRDLRKQKGLDLERRWDIFSDGCEGGESMQQVTERLDRLIMQIKEIQKPYMHGEDTADILLVAHGLILRCFWKRWLGISIDYPLRMMLDPGEIAILSYKNNDIDETAFHLGVQLPCEEEMEGIER